TANGYGKRTSLEEYPVKGRATGGVITIRLRPGDEVAVAHVVHENSLLTLITESGMVMRTEASGISMFGRHTQGVTIVNLAPNDRVAALCVEDLEENGERNDHLELDQMLG
ncbi:MAG: DNA gyrase C-terminal beta-propeller domain-containing protein, partial [Roseiflexaceae bacterium]|nr:DNA gyrase C-terminal beta-propeller domain-containing protein [Roseiflexaceae bacterium]